MLVFFLYYNIWRKHHFYGLWNCHNPFLIWISFQQFIFWAFNDGKLLQVVPQCDIFPSTTSSGYFHPFCLSSFVCKFAFSRFMHSHLGSLQMETMSTFLPPAFSLVIAFMFDMNFTSNVITFCFSVALSALLGKSIFQWSIFVKYHVSLSTCELNNWCSVANHWHIWKEMTTNHEMHLLFM